LVAYQYDALGRRVVKKSYLLLSQENRYIYDGDSFNILVELDANATIQKSYVWGDDLSRIKHGAGGIGGLVTIINHITGKRYYPLYDTMGNVTELTDETGAVVARYRYSAYGKLIEESGVAAGECSFRFSTKYWDAEVGLYWYGYRYYSAELGRWLTRDPLREEGGLNLYAFVKNSPINKWDATGLVTGVEDAVEIIKILPLPLQIKIIVGTVMGLWAIGKVLGPKESKCPPQDPPENPEGLRLALGVGYPYPGGAPLIPLIEFAARHNALTFLDWPSDILGEFESFWAEAWRFKAGFAIVLNRAIVRGGRIFFNLAAIDPDRPDKPSRTKMTFWEVEQYMIPQHSNWWAVTEFYDNERRLTSTEAKKRMKEIVGKCQKK
jgi:RHS repeat-associated protein